MAWNSKQIEDFEQAAFNAQMAVLQKIAATAPEDNRAGQVKDLAEAYAWLRNTNQPH